MRLAPKNIRTRLTLWYLFALTIILLFFAGLSLSLVFMSLRKDMDDELENDYEVLEEIIKIAPDGQVSIDEKRDPYFKERWVEIWTPEGKKLYESRPFSARALPSISNEVKNVRRFTFQSLTLAGGERVRLMYGRVNIEGRWLIIRIVHSEERLWRDLWATTRVFLLAFPLSLFVAGLGGFLLTKKLLQPIDQMTDKARRISEENLEERLPVSNPDDELGNLARTFNRLLERIERSFKRLRQFTSDAAHELRTPLTAIQSIGEVSLQEHRDAKYYRNVIGSILEENRRLTHLIDSLLFLSRADSERIKINRQPFPLEEFVEQTIDLIQPLAEEKKQRIVLRGENGLKLNADKYLLREALLNILDNAIKYSPEATQIEVQIVKNHQHAQILVSDQGMGIPADQLNKIFKRFYRVDKARSRLMGGSGLGLSIARWAVRIQGGDIRVKSKEGQGSTFIIEFPLKSNT